MIKIYAKPEVYLMPSTSWSYLGKGAYNDAYQSADKKHVLKIPYGCYEATDTPERAVRLWNLINPQLEPARIYGNGWICPFVEGEQASDEEMSEALLRIFNDTGRIIVDAPAPRNFIKTPQNQVICVDIGLALQLENRAVHRRRQSMVSLNTWEGNKISFGSFLGQASRHYPYCVETIKALLFIQHHRPDIFNADFLKRNRGLVTQLAIAYDNPNNRSASMTELNEHRPVTLEHTRKAINIALERYIASRGKISHEKFIPSARTRFFRNTELTTEKALFAEAIISKIAKANTYSELENIIKNHNPNDNIYKAKFSSGLKNALEHCALIIQVAASKNADRTQAPTP